jgi:hypothetical protein
MNNKNLTRYQFSKMLRNALAFTGYSPDEFNTHSLRIGAATQSFLNGSCCKPKNVPVGLIFECSPAL